MSDLDRFITSWFVTDAVLLSYWEIAEATHPGRQYASPYLPCAWMATLFAPIVFLTWRLIRTIRARRPRPTMPGSELITIDHGRYRLVCLPPDAVVSIGDQTIRIPAGQTRLAYAPGHRYELVDWASRE